MVGDNDSVQLSEYCFNVCEVLNIAIRRKDVNDIDESTTKALENLEGCVG